MLMSLTHESLDLKNGSSKSRSNRTIEAKTVSISHCSFPCQVKTEQSLHSRYVKPEVDFSTIDSSTEYISSLRSCVQEGRRLDGSSSSRSHVNTAEFWRNEFKRSEEAQIELRARIFELEKRLDAPEESRSATPAGVASQKERRQGASQIERGPDTATRKRSWTTVNEPTAEDDDGSLETRVNGMKSASDHDGETFYHRPASWR